MVNTGGQIDVASFVFNLYNSIGFYRYTFYIDIFYNYAFHYDYILIFFEGGEGGGCITGNNTIIHILYRYRLFSLQRMHTIN